MVSQHIDMLVPMPTSWWERWKERGKFFDQDGRPTEGREVWCELEESLEDGVQHYRHKLEKGVFGEEETRAILTLVRQMLKFEPEEQPTIQQVLEYVCMVKWVLLDWGVAGTVNSLFTSDLITTNIQCILRKPCNWRRSSPAELKIAFSPSGQYTETPLVI